MIPRRDILQKVQYAHSIHTYMYLITAQNHFKCEVLLNQNIESFISCSY